MSDNNISQREYRNEIESSANIILDEAIERDEWPLHSDRFEEELNRDVERTADNHKWQMYPCYALDVLERAKNEPEEWQIYVDPERENNHRHVLCAMAYACFLTDLREATMEELERRREETPVPA